MIALITHALRVVQSVVREHAKKVTRSSKWNGVRKTALKANPKCAACGSDKFLQVHHMQPFHLKPELELDLKNLIVLCMGPNECHLLLGHGDNFKKYNPYIAADAKNVAAGSITGEQAKALAKKNAIFLPLGQ
jgi:5-methylcytosine-specific restriction endonuclease McrA